MPVFTEINTQRIIKQRLLCLLCGRTLGSTKEDGKEVGCGLIYFGFTWFGLISSHFTRGFSKLSWNKSSQLSMNTSYQFKFSL